MRKQMIKEKTLKQLNKKSVRVVILALILLTVCWYFGWRMIFTIPYDENPFQIAGGIVLLLLETVITLKMLMQVLNFFKNLSFRHEIPNYDNEDFPEVDVFVTTCGEPVELLEKTLKAARAMNYPNPSKVHVHLLDDGDNPKMKEMSARVGVHYITRDDHHGAKAGNINNALKCTSAPLVVIFDADMVPLSDFLITTVPYFFVKNDAGVTILNESMGFLQTPQAFYNRDLYQHAFGADKYIPNEQEHFYRNIEPCRNGSNSVVFGGSNAVLLRSAIEKVGGFAEDTITEDFATGLLIQKAGYSSMAIDKVVALGLAPNNLRSMIKQRERWGRGTIQTVRKCGMKGFSFWQKLNILSAVGYWIFPLEKMLLFLAPLLFPLFGIALYEASLWEMLLHWVPLCVMTQLCLIFFSGRNRNLCNLRWSYIYDMSMTPFLFFPILAEIVGIKKKRFEITGAGNKKEGRSIWYVLPFAVMFVLTAVALVITAVLAMKRRDIGYFFLILWLLINLYILSFEIIFAIRAQKRSDDEFRYDDMAHNLDYCPLPIYDLVRAIFAPWSIWGSGLKKSKSNGVVIDYAMLEDMATESMRKKWNRKRYRHEAGAYVIAALIVVLLMFFVSNNWKVPVSSIYESRFEGINSDMLISDWKNEDTDFYSAFDDGNVQIAEGTLKLEVVDSTENGETVVTGGELRFLPFFGYGKYTVVMKPCNRSGIVSSFFTYTGELENNPWDEIDFEFTGKDTRVVYLNFYANGSLDNGKAVPLDFDAAEDFHEYSFEWREDSITWYVDGREIYRVSDEDAVIPSHPGHIIMNTWQCNPVSDSFIVRWGGEYKPSDEYAAAEYRMVRYEPLQ